MSDLPLVTRADGVENVAKALFENWKLRIRRQESLLGQAPPTKRSYSTDAWEDLPPSFKSTFLEDADLVVDCLLEYVKTNPDAYGDRHEPS
jgi:hypothetical protein